MGRGSLFKNDWSTVLQTLVKERVHLVNPADTSENGLFKFSYDVVSYPRGNIQNVVLRRVSKYDLKHLASFDIGNGHEVLLSMDRDGFIYLLKQNYDKTRESNNFDVLVSIHHLIGKKIHSDSQKDAHGVFIADNILSYIPNLAEVHADMYGLPKTGINLLPKSQKDLALDSAYALALNKSPSQAIVELAKEYAKRLLNQHQQIFLRQWWQDISPVDDIIQTAEAMTEPKNRLKKIAKNVAKANNMRKKDEKALAEVAKDMHGATMVAYLSQHRPIIDTHGEVDDPLSKIEESHALKEYWDTIVKQNRLVGDPAIVEDHLPVLLAAHVGGKQIWNNKALEISRMSKRALALYTAYKELKQATSRKGD